MRMSMIQMNVQHITAQHSRHRYHTRADLHLPTNAAALAGNARTIHGENPAANPLHPSVV